MKKLLLLLLIAFFTRCTKEIIEKQSVDNKVIPDFGYSVIPRTSSTSESNLVFDVKYYNASQNVPNGSTTVFETVGFSDGYSIEKDGYYSIVITIITPDGIKFAKSHSFCILNNKFLNENFQLNTNFRDSVVVDFVYSLIPSTTKSDAIFYEISSGISPYSTLTWYVDGKSLLNDKGSHTNTYSFTTEGKHFVLLIITTPSPEKKTYKISKEFNVMFKP